MKYANNLMLSSMVALFVFTGAIATADEKADIKVEDNRIIVANDTIHVEWILANGIPTLARIDNRLDNTNLELPKAPVFTIEIDEKVFTPSDFKIIKEAVVKNIVPVPDASVYAEQLPGKQISITLMSSDNNIEFEWKAELRNGSHYVRQIFALKPLRQTVRINKFTPMMLSLGNIRKAGYVTGVPVTLNNMFFAYELPHSKIENIKPGISLYATVNSDYEPDHLFVQSTVIGCASKGQMRRSFLSYIERERAHPYHQFLHYQSWYDLHTPDYAGNSKEFVDTIKGWNECFVKPYTIQFDSFVLDDGWDDLTDCWAVHKGLFPEGFKPLSDEASRENVDCGVGLWFSPAGGYLFRAGQRMKHGKPKGYTYHLSHPKYYDRFREMTSKYIRENGVNYFKFDRLGSWADTEATFRLAKELRKINSDVFINVTCGSWPSPLFLLNADSTWRGGGDMGYTGKGSKTQQWINFRDKTTYTHVCKRSPLYPLNSLMTTGIVYGHRFRGAFINEGLKDFKDQVRSFFGCGTNLQELYISYRRLLPEYWEALAEGAKWAKANEDVMVDTHWIGGNPSRNEVYGWASWCKRKGVITLRNPDDKERTFKLDVQEVFELPDGAPQNYTLKSPWKEDLDKPVITAAAGTAVDIKLEPFEVINFDATL